MVGHLSEVSWSASHESRSQPGPGIHSSNAGSHVPLNLFPLLWRDNLETRGHVCLIPGPIGKGFPLGTKGADGHCSC